METGEWVAVGGIGAGLVGAGVAGWWLAAHQTVSTTTPSTEPSLTLTPSTSPSTSPSTTPSTSPTAPRTFQLVASEPKARTGQAVTLTARATYSGTPPNAALHIIDLSTKTIVGSGSSMEVLATVMQNSQQTVSYQATMTVNGIPYTSNTVAVEWSQVATGTNQGRPNALGQTVSITGPNTFTTGNMLTVTAHPQGFTNPVFQFWALAPGGNWEQSGGYLAKSTWTVQANEPGQWNFAVYAREASAPTGETPAQQAQYEAKSGPLLITVSGGSYVQLVGPTVVTPNTTLIVRATPVRISNPEYQYWYRPPNGTWQQTPWQSDAAHAWAAGNINGVGQAIVYCRQVGTTYKHFSATVYVLVGNTAAVPASDASVALSIPHQASVGQSVTWIASSTGITNPVYQFWYMINSRTNNSTWNSNGPYQSSAEFTLNASTPGTWQVTVVCRSALAPTNETAVQRATFEKSSAAQTMIVS